MSDVPATGTSTITLNMTEGTVAITLNRAQAPCTVNSFESLAKQGFFDDTTCHRLVDQGIYILQIAVIRPEPEAVAPATASPTNSPARSITPRAW